MRAAELQSFPTAALSQRVARGRAGMRCSRTGAAVAKPLPVLLPAGATLHHSELSRVRSDNVHLFASSLSVGIFEAL